MKRKLAEAIIDAADLLGIEMRHYDDYSGRGMNGKETAAVVYDDRDDFASCCFALGASLTDHGLVDIEDQIRQLRTDSLGKGFVTY